MAGQSRGADSGVCVGAPPDGPVPEIGPAPEDYTPTAANAPDTDIWMATLDRSDGGLAVVDVVPIIARDGYDNQPNFEVTEAHLLYVSDVDRLQTEVSRYSLSARSHARVTITEGASEFSPVQVPGMEAFSAIREQNGKQYLWCYGLDGTDLGPVFSSVEPVGYHAWADGRVVAMFVLGNPPTLQVGDAVTGEVSVVAENPGRSIHRIPGTDEISFIRKLTDEEWVIEALDPVDMSTTPITSTLSESEDYAWTPEGEILMGQGSTLHSWTEDSGWVQVADLAEDGIQGITRLAVNPEGTRLAIVGTTQGD